MKTKILSILALLLTMTQGAWAQETLTVFDETGTSQHIPMHGYDFDSYTKSECIIPASVLTAMEGGTITAITFYVKEVDGMNSTFSPANQKVFLKEVSETTLSSYSGMDDATVVFDGTLPMPTTTGGYTITFSQGYTYNGGNLLIGVYNDAKGLYNIVTWYGDNNQSDRVSAYGYNYGSLASVGFTKQTFLPKTTFTYTPAPFSGGSGTQASPYEIASTTDWNNLVTAVNGGETYSGKYFKMTANVGTVSTWMTGTFSGTFDGDGNTLTVGYSATTNNCAPFGYLNGTVQNLKVAGNISTSKQYAGGLAAWVKTGHTANVTNCRVAATINSTYSGDGSSAGFVAYVDGRLNVTGCAFTGTLAGSNAYAWGGFVSYNVGTSVITNCLFAPASVTAKADYSATVGRNGGGTLNFATNFYYTQKFNTAQGLQARTIVKGDGVSTLSVTKGSGTTYNVAGITVYSNGVDYNSTFYGGSGQTVSLALTAETRTGYQFTQYAASQGTLSAQTATSATLTMPAANSTANDAVTVTAQYSVPAATPVDLGLPSGTKWADMNVGAGSETGYGTYYAWSSSDIATAQWGVNWRMPTLTEVQELINNTDHEWTTIGGVNGMKYMKKTDHSVYIFIPAAGWNANTNVGTKGTYWTSTTLEADDSKAYELFLDASNTTTGNDRKTYQFTVRPVQMFAGEGTEASPYLIASTTDWNNLVSAVNAGETYSGNYFKMTANVDASKMIGSSTETFKGNFDGDGYTLNLNINMTASSSQIAAPFAYVVGGTIKNVKLTGTVNTAGMRSSSLIGYADNCTIRNCTSSVAISSSRNNDVDGGAFVACVIANKTVTIEGCAFTGSITFSDAAGYEGGGFVGWMRSPSTVTLTDCLFAPSAVSLAKASPAFKMFAYDNAGTTLTLNNCYYNGTAACNEKITKQDGTMQMHTIAAGDYVITLSVTKGDATATYDVSGITVYSGGIDFNDGSTTTFYGGSEQTVSLTLTAETRSGYHFKQYAASQGSLSGETTNTPTLTMPAANSTANDAVTISAEYDPTYNADFADGNDNDGWTIDPTQQIEGGTVTVSYTGENKVKSVTVTKLALCSLSEVTSEHIGKIIGADGNVYASLAQAEKVTSAVGVLGKVTETGHGLIMSLEDAPKQVWATIDGWASASYAGTTLKVLPDDDARGSNLPSYTTLGSTTVSNWAVATRADYTAIFTNLGSTRSDSDGITYDEHVNAYITSAGGTAISGENWSITGYNDAIAWRFSYENYWGARNKTYQFKVRPVLGF